MLFLIEPTKRNIPVEIIEIIENLFSDCIACIRWENSALQKLLRACEHELYLADNYGHQF